jgi:hypothetical protein
MEWVGGGRSDLLLRGCKGRDGNRKSRREEEEAESFRWEEKTSREH